MNKNDPASLMKVCPACGQLFVPSFDVCSIDNCQLKSVTDEELVGTVFDNTYRILSLVGTGGMATVYKAMHKELGFEVALKLLRLSLLEDENTKARFVREAKVLQALSHPNIVSVKEFSFTKTGQPYLVMDYLNGQTLQSLLKGNGSLPADQGCDLFVQISSALEHAHKQGIVHRDLKPGNIVLLDDNNKLKAMIVDFGIAKLLPTLKISDNQKLTKTGHAFGTPTYMSPEQWRGESIDERSDIYSLGCIMCETITNKVPFDMESLVRIIYNNEEAASFSLRDRQADIRVSKELEQIVLKCLSFDKAQRYRSVAELKDELCACPEYRISSGSATVRLAPKQAPEERSRKNTTFVFGTGILLLIPVIVIACAATLVHGNTCKAGIIPTKFAIWFNSQNMNSNQKDQFALRKHLIRLLTDQKEYIQASDCYVELLRSLEALSDKRKDQEIAYACFDYSKCLACIPGEDKKARDMANRALRLFKHLSALSLQQREFKQAIQYARQAVVLTRELKGSDEELAVQMGLLADYEQHLALLDSTQMKLLFEAEDFHEQSIALLQKDADRNQSAILHNKFELSILYLGQNRIAKAKQTIEEAFAEAKLKYKPEDPQLQSMANYVETVADHFYKDRKYDQAEGMYQKVLQVREAAPETETRALGCANFYIGNCEMFRERYDQAEIYLERALKIYKTTDGPESYPTALVHLSLAECQAQLHNLKEAWKNLEICTPVIRTHDEDAMHLQIALRLYARVMKELGSPEKAEGALAELSSLKDRTNYTEGH